MNIDRRKFLKSSFSLCGATIIGSSIFLESCQKSAVNPAGNINFTLDLSQPANAALNTPGGSIVSKGVIVVNSAGTFVALSDICTHQGCLVYYNKSGNDFLCPCHAGAYNISGAVIAGPPPAALTKYNVSQSGNILTITG